MTQTGVGARPSYLAHALEGVTVLDFGLFLAGPITGRVLADLGARVIKVEETRGDPRRGMIGTLSFTQRGKEGIALDIKSAEGRQIVYKLVERADVLLHNMRLGVPERLGIDYETVREINPRIIYCHCTGYGSKGPRAKHPAMEYLHSGLAGILHNSGGEGNPPLLPMTSMDHTSGMSGALAILMGLYERARSGEGQSIEVLQNGVALLCNSDVHFAEGEKSSYLALDKDQTGHGPLNRLYRTADGWLCISCRQEREWESLCDVLGAQELMADERFATSRKRSKNAAALGGILQGRLAERTTAAWTELLDAHGVPCEEPRQTAPHEFSNDPDDLATGLVADYVHPQWGRTREVGLTIRLSETPGRNHAPAPLLGQHTHQVLEEIGYSPDEITSMRDRGVVAWED